MATVAAAATTTLPKLIPILLIILLSTTLTSANPTQLLQNPLPKSLGLKKQKLSHLHFYFHDIVGGKNPTAVRVAQAAMTNKSPTLFGVLVMMDDPLTMQPEPSSTPVGRAQGIYSSASQSETALLMVMNFAFTHGKYNGSTLSVLGRNAVFNTVRELPIVGGTGLFRFASGYAQAKTHTFDLKSGDAVVEYNVYVFHY
ncbi:dirigent protein 22-like [Pistacia vera]|uniref:dirigent protein 22-like n=1 Tax=Pistacia vera TaxID=55513 RepID=UPI0012639001|nr:dirigent protein 22-like [Pistacia vera]